MKRVETEFDETEFLEGALDAYYMGEPAPHLSVPALLFLVLVFDANTLVIVPVQCLWHVRVENPASTCY